MSGMGVCGVGHRGEPAPYRLRPDLCGGGGHPGVTYNPWADETWCLCGAKITAGNAVVWPLADTAGGPLCEVREKVTT